MAATKGDRIIVESQSVGTPTRQGEILEVIEGAVSIRYRVRWDSGQETVFTPSLGSARIEPRAGNGRAGMKGRTAKATTRRPGPQTAAKRSAAKAVAAKTRATKPKRKR